MGDFDKLGFEVEVKESSFDTTISRLNTILKKLEEIENYEKKVGRNSSISKGNKTSSKTIGTSDDVELRAIQLKNEERRKAVDLEIKRNGALSEGFKKFSESGQLNEPDKKVAKDKGEYQAYLDLQKLVEQEERLNSAWSKQIETLRLLNQEKQKKLTYDIISNDSNVRAENVATKIAQLNANTAVSADLAASAEGRLALEERARVQYGQQLITQMERLRAEQEALNNGKWEEVRAIELANKQRKQEIDTRLKSQLGLKEEHQQVRKNTNVWSTYLAKITSVVMLARRLGSFFAAAIQESASYTENLVLFSTAFGKSTEDQLEWAENLAKSYGLARNEVVKFAGTFRELSNSIGLAGETADYVTRAVTNLGYDLSALFNTSVTTAMEKLQASIFTGQTKPLRYYGIDISQESIDRLIETDSVLKELGVSARDLSQSEKTVARLLITMRSASNSFGTMAKEINNLQSQFRIFQGSLSEFKLAIGNLVQEPLRNAMVFINGFIIALTNIINAFAPQKEDKTIFDSTTEGAENTANAIEDANKQYDELTGKLAGFDKFNVLQQKEDNSSTLAVTNRLNELLFGKDGEDGEVQKYEKTVQEAMDKIKNEAVKIGKTIKNWFVFDTGEVDSNDNPIYKLTAQAEGLFNVLTALAGVSAFAWASSAIKAANAATLAGESLTGLAKSGQSLKAIFNPKTLGIVSVVGALTYMYTTNENFRKSLNETVSKLMNSLKPVLETIGGIIEDLAPQIVEILGFLANMASSVLDFANNLGILEPAIVAIVSIKFLDWLLKLNNGLKLTNNLLLTGVVVAVLEAIKAFKEGDYVTGVLATTVGVELVGAWAALNWEMLKTTAIKIVDFFKGLGKVLIKQTEPALLGTTKAISAMEMGLLALSTAFALSGLNALWSSEASAGEKLTHTFLGLAAAIAAAAIAMAAFQQNWVQAVAIGATVAGGYFTVASLSAQGFADGGYTNANLIMTHENGKREWVGKAAGSSAIVNDTQMSDIMETAVAKGVYRAFSNSRTESSSGGTTKNIYNFQVSGRTLLSVMEDEARKQGKKLVKA